MPLVDVSIESGASCSGLRSPDSGECCVFNSDATYKGTRSRKLRPGELEQIEASARKIAIKRLERHKSVLDSLTHEQLRSIAQMDEPAVLCGKWDK